MFFPSDLSHLNCRKFASRIGRIGVCFHGDGFGGNSELDIVGITVEPKTIVKNDVAEGEDLDGEPERTKH